MANIFSISSGEDALRDARILQLQNKPNLTLREQIQLNNDIATQQIRRRQAYQESQSRVAEKELAQRESALDLANSPLARRQADIQRQKSEIEARMFDPSEYAKQLWREKNPRLAASLERERIAGLRLRGVTGLDTPTVSSSVQQPNIQGQMAPNGQQLLDGQRSNIQSQMASIEAGFFNPERYKTTLQRQQELEDLAYGSQKTQFELRNKMMQNMISGLGTTANSSFGNRPSWMNSYFTPRFPA
jgi:hypothetical protein